MATKVFATPDYRLYIVDATTTEDKINRIEDVIDALMTTMLEASLNQDITEYRLDDGQTKVQTIYRSVEQIRKSIEGLEALIEMYKAKVQGRIVRLIDHESSRNLRKYR